jgi:polyhydroxyalkanoate synthesis regulator phasin
MGIPWKKIGKGLLGIGESGLLPIPWLAPIIHGVEAAVTGPGQGATKFAMVSTIADAVVSQLVDIGVMTPEQVQKLNDLKTAAINSYVALKNLEAQGQADMQALHDFLGSLKHPS